MSRKKRRELKTILLFGLGLLLFWWWLDLTATYQLTGAWLLVPFAAAGALYVAWRSRRHLWRWLSKAFRSWFRRLRRKKDFREINLDSVHWDDFEDLIAELFRTRGFKTKMTRRTGDQGVDIIAEKSNLRIGIQCKRYTGAVGNDAVMAAIAGSKYYQCNRTLVVCTSTFTRAAVELADATGVQLWDRGRLERELNWI